MKPEYLKFTLLAALLLAGCTLPRNTRGNLALATSDVQRTSPAPALTATPSPTPTQVPATLTPFLPITITPTETSIPATPTQLACMKSSGVMVLESLESQYLPKAMNFRVFLPPCYYDDLDRKYPVLYIIHGQSYNSDQWDRLGMDDAAARLFTAGELPPFLIVMPEDRVWTEPEADPFGKVLMEDLLPRIDATYRTLPEARYRAIGGLSRGAAWAVYLGLRNPDVFGAIGGHSLPVFWSDTYSLRERLKGIPPDQMPRIYLDDGEKDRYLDSAVWFEQLLTELNIPHEWYLFAGYHEEKYWAEHVEDYLRFYAAGWPF